MLRTVTTADELREIDSSPWAVLLLTADWSKYAAYARKVITRVSSTFPVSHPEIDVRFFVMEEGEPFADVWIDRFEIPYLRPLTADPHTVLGNGSVLLLRNGKVAWFYPHLMGQAGQTLPPNLIVGFREALDVAGGKLIEEKILYLARGIQENAPADRDSPNQ
ncbi:MAG: hypothetical protein V4671_31740 [Armatimonadota bacterium]